MPLNMMKMVSQGQDGLQSYHYLLKDIENILIKNSTLSAKLVRFHNHFDKVSSKFTELEDQVDEIENDGESFLHVIPDEDDLMLTNDSFRDKPIKPIQK